MRDTADAAQLDADRLSFTRSLRLAHRQITAQAAFSPDHLAAALTDGLREMARLLLPTRRRRFKPRVIKRKMSGFGLKRDEHRHPPQPDQGPAEAVVIAPHWRTASINPPTKVPRSWDPTP